MSSYALTVTETQSVLSVPGHGTVVMPLRDSTERRDIRLVHEATGWNLPHCARVVTALRSILVWARQVREFWSEVTLRLDLKSVMVLTEDEHIDMSFAGTLNGYSFLTSFRMPTDPANTDARNEVFVSIDNLTGGVDSFEYSNTAPDSAPDALADTPYESFADLMTGHSTALLGARVLALTLQS